MTKTNINNSISIIGSGNVATHLALALHGAGHTIRQVLSREFDHASLLASRVSAQPIDRVDRLDNQSDVYLLAVNDDALYDLALDLHLPDALVVHTSGSTPASVLKPVSRHYGVVWSPQTFVRDLAMDYTRLPLCIEGCNPTVEANIETLFSTISNHIQVLVRLIYLCFAFSIVLFNVSCLTPSSCQVLRNGSDIWSRKNSSGCSMYGRTFRPSYHSSS